MRLRLVVGAARLLGISVAGVLLNFCVGSTSCEIIAHFTPTDSPIASLLVTPAIALSRGEAAALGCCPSAADGGGRALLLEVRKDGG